MSKKKTATRKHTAKHTEIEPTWREMTQLLLVAGDVAPHATREALKRVITAQLQLEAVGAEALS